MTATAYLRLLTGSDDAPCFSLPTTDDILAIGRDEACNICLPAKSEDGVSRKHCTLQRVDGMTWHLVDCSTNGTLLEAASGEEIDVYGIPGRSLTMCVGDVLALPARPLPQWRLRLEDPNRTCDHIAPKERRPTMRYVIHLDRQVVRYDFRGQQWDVKESLGLRLQAKKLLLCMGQKNWQMGCETPCTHDELIAAVWGDEASSHTKDDLAGLVKEIRKDLPIANLIEAKKKIGYVLHASGDRAPQ